jgi:superoxide dismutase, Fe-Mn family
LRCRNILTNALPGVDDYGALEPHISGKIMEIHHKNHHQTYVDGLNSALERIVEAHATGNEIAAAAVAPLLNFHGGGHTNHTLFWENLSPANKDGGGEPEGALKVHYPLSMIKDK